jgi:hypothetical protein
MNLEASKVVTGLRQIVCCLVLSLMVLAFLSVDCRAGDQGLSFGYGFAALNKHTSTGRIEGGKNYDFIQASYLYEKPIWEKVSFLVEPFAAYINRPESGADVGFNLLLRWYPASVDRIGLFFDAGGGIAYTSIAFKEQGTHLLGILAGGVGYRYNAFFTEARFRHYSNGATATPNRSVNAVIISVGTYF